MKDLDKNSAKRQKKGYRVTVYLGKKLYTDMEDIASALNVPLRSFVRMVLELGFNVANKIESETKRNGDK